MFVCYKGELIIYKYVYYVLVRFLKMLNLKDGNIFWIKFFKFKLCRIYNMFIFIYFLKGICFFVCYRDYYCEYVFEFNKLR